MTGLMSRLRGLLVHRILGLDDTPHRIAWGVLLGAIITFTPTIGFQIAIYVAVATMVRANKISGIPILFASNPFTAVPMYYFTWRVGALLVPGERMSSETVRRRLRRLTDADAGWSQVIEVDFWTDVGRTLVDMGLELWVGGLVIGLLVGTPIYFVSYWGVMEYRRRTWRGPKRSVRRTPSQP
jgi:uncharacterized protein